MVTFVFTTVGILAFFAALRTAAITRQGTAQTYYSTQTELGKTVNKGVSQDQLRWPSKFGTYAGDANNYEGTIAQNQIAQPDSEKGYTQGQARSELYTYEPVDWSISKELRSEEKK